MKFHPDKCFVLRVTNKRKIIDSNYKIHGQELQVVDKAKYLGVTISKNLSWKNHISNNISKATAVSLFLQQNLPKTDSGTRLACYMPVMRFVYILIIFCTCTQYYTSLLSPSLVPFICTLLQSKNCLVLNSKQ